MKKALLYHFVLLLSAPVVGQDSLHLSEAVISADRGMELHSENLLDSLIVMAQPAADLGTLLLHSGKGYFPQYGAKGSLITARLGGTSAGHTAINWNGLPLESPSLGMSDLSLIPLFLFDGSISYQNSGARFSGGAFGGAVNIQDHGLFGQERGWNIMTSANTLSNASVGVKYLGGDSFFRFKTGVLMDGFENNFVYNDPYSGEIGVKQTNNDGRQAAFSQSFSKKFKNQSRVNIDVWYVVRKVKIPNLMSPFFGSRIQSKRDSLLRSALEYIRPTARGVISGRISYLSDYQRYQSRLVSNDPTGGIDSRIHARRGVVDLDWKRFWNTRWQSHLGFRQMGTRVFNNNYNDGSARAQISSAFGSLTREENHGRLTLNLRSEVLQLEQDGGLGVPYPPTLAADVTYSGAFRKNSWRFHPFVMLARKNRLPDFNALFWVPGGNVKLRPEQGTQVIVGTTTLKRLKNQNVLESSARYKSSGIQDWIQWVPVRGIFTATNYKYVNIKQWDLAATFRSSSKFSLKIHYVNTSSTFQDEGGAEGVLPYSPKHQVNTLVSGRLRSWTLLLNGRWTGSRYTDALNSEFLALAPMHTASISLTKHFEWDKSSCLCSVHIENLFNQSLEYIKYYPTPGRVVEINIQLQIKPSK